ncbi:hypothetical protein F4777DRAFT_562240 [Nemania sp. FL0916]|nr:hypothetical protein F4777DRAFT_562240 [Nemania sp. FL0916]
MLATVPRRGTSDHTKRVTGDTSASWAIVVDHGHEPFDEGNNAAILGDAAYASLPFARIEAPQALEIAVGFLAPSLARLRSLGELSSWHYERSTEYGGRIVNRLLLIWHENCTVCLLCLKLN